MSLYKEVVFKYPSEYSSIRTWLYSIKPMNDDVMYVLEYADGPPVVGDIVLPFNSKIRPDRYSPLYKEVDDEQENQMVGF